MGTRSAFGEGSHTRAHTPKQGPSLLRSQCGFVLPAKSLLFHRAFIYIHFPVLCEPPTISREKKSGETAAINFIPNRFSSRFSTSRTNGPRSLSRAKAGTRSAFGERSHTRAHTPKQGPSGRGCYYYPRTVSHVSETLRGRGIKRRTLPFLGLGRVYARRTQKAFGTAMRLCASLSRGVAAPLGCVIFLQFGDVAVFSLYVQYFLNVRGMGVSLPSARFACSRNAGRPLAKAANLPFSEVGWSSLIPVAQKQKQHLTANSPGSL